jgi:hypothetical protein
VNSSTSNSKFFKGPWFSTLGISAVLLLLYSGLAPVLFPRGGAALHQWQENTLRIERYAFSKRELRCVITGSSMAARIRQDLLDPRDYNLAASGRSALVGLNAILRREPRPPCVLVEANWTLLGAVDSPEVDRVFKPLPYFLKVHFPALREMFQPSALFAQWLKDQRPQQKADVRDVNYEEHLRGQRELEEREPDQFQVQSKVKLLSSLIGELTRSGTQVFLFDTPMEPALMSGSRSEALRTALRSQMPDMSWLEFDPNRYQTEDGVHLNASSAEQFTRDLANEIQLRIGNIY